MIRETLRPKAQARHLFLASALSLALTATALAAPPPLAVTTNDRPWLHEAEFDADASLHATYRQTVVLDLESRDRGRGALRSNRVRFLVEEARDYSFCIPEADPYLVRLKLQRERGPTVSEHRRGRPCEPVALAPGSYELRVVHDSRRLPEGGKQAFLQQPRGASLFGDGQPNFIAIRGPNGDFITDANTTDPRVPLGPRATSVGLREVWRLLGFGTNHGTKYNLRNGEGTTALYDQGDEGCGFDVRILAVPNVCNAPPAQFHINDQGGGRFDLVLESWVLEDWTRGGIYIDGNDSLFFNTSQFTTGETLTWEYKGFDCATTCDAATLPLQPGEVALYAECGFKGPAIVFQADTPDLSLYDDAAAQGLGIGDDMAASIRVGPDTLVFLYDQPGFAGNVEAVGADISCLDTISIGTNTVSSFQLKALTQFIVSTNGCQNCVLTGVDLSAQDFTDSDFSRSILDDADLTDTAFSGATLESTHFSAALLSGADFSGADLSCSQFNGADLTGVSFANNPVVEDYSCYLNLSGAMLDFSTFPVEKWRFFDLQGSMVGNLPAELSTASDPLDLSGAILSNVGWLAGETLDAANLGCFASQPGQTEPCPDPSGASVCTTLQGTNLSGASLKGACLKDARLQGALLSSSNLDGADLSGAQLLGLPNGGRPATLEGAFLRNASLAGADLTGVIANHVNFYSASGGTADATNATMTSAKFNNAYLAGADFGGSDAVLQSTEWTQAVLVGANFDGADLSKNETADEITDFTGAYLQGAVFSNAAVTDADFTSSYWDLSNDPKALNLQMQTGNLEFTGYWKAATDPECVQATYPDANFPTAGPPITAANNICPNGAPGPCDAVWEMPRTPIEQAIPKSAMAPALPPNPGNQCNITDLCWLIDSPLCAPQ